MTVPGPCQGDGRLTNRCHCRRCARILPHLAENTPTCDCGAQLGRPGAISLCRRGLDALSEEELQEHIQGRRTLDNREKGMLL